MNATPLVSQIPIGDPAQHGTAVADKSGKAGGESPDFAAALSKAGGRPFRKAGGTRQDAAGAVGRELPAAGNPTPPTTTAAAGSRSDPGAAVSGPQLEGADQKAGHIPAASRAAASRAAASPAAVPASTAAAGPGARFALGGGLAGADPGASGGDTSGALELATAPLAEVNPGAQAALGIPGSAEAKGVAGAGRAPAGTPRGGAGKPSAAAATAATTAATSGPSGGRDSDAPAVANAGAWTVADVTAQATAAAMAVVAPGVIASSEAGFAGAVDSPASPTSESVVPAAGVTAPGGSVANGAPGAALAASGARPAGTAAAAAGANAQTLTMLANASDKRASSESQNSALSAPPGDSAAAALQVGMNTASAADAASMPTLNLAARVDTPEFGQGLAERVSWMVDNNLNGAKLQVNPPQLGPIEIRIAVQGGHAQVWLTSHSAVTRDALESSSPKLREMLGAQGFGQVSVDISQRSFQERTAHSQPYDWTPSANASATEAIQPATRGGRGASSGAVDAYA